MSPSDERRLIKLDQALSQKLKRPLAIGLAKVLEPILGINRFNREYIKLLEKDQSDDQFLQRALALLIGSVQVSHSELERIPASGGVILVANHPFGGIEGVMLAVLLKAIRPDIKFIANYMLGQIPEFRDLLIPVDPFGGESATKRNVGHVVKAIRWVRKEQGLLVIFPAGEVSSLELKSRRVVDPAWQVGAARIIRAAQAQVIPLLFQGSNGPLFQLAGLIHPRLRTALLPREMLNKGQRDIPLRIGHPIAFSRLDKMESDQELIDYLRMRTYLLDADEKKEPRTPLSPQSNKSVAALEPIISACDPQLLRKEIDQLPAAQRLLSSGNQTVYVAHAHQIPMLLQEIGRLREITFREVGEGTGKSIDLDIFDAHYMHLFIWQEQAQELVGAYRMGRLDHIMGSSAGKKGLYTSTLFKYKKSFLKQLGPALEMGRSFVRPEYQRSYAPLLLLWKGIGHYVVAHPEYKVLFGPVSITTEYTPASRQLIVGYLKSHNDMENPPRMIKARKPYRLQGLKGLVSPQAIENIQDVDALSGLVAEIERDGKGVPILLKQYLKLGGRIAGFNIDPDFSDVLDGLIFVDLTQTEQRTLNKYMGAAGAERFLAYHAQREHAPTAPPSIEAPGLHGSH
ncbi:phospholipid/glycerol acyltransferase [Magnetococcus marinus MC-1]|uniref:L-ornithine N(alpha)-acyltransferase n=1 Tax=Magnetococcus marinus (strain ATCC BAA-1437 / JCM 17883 / MC-1) TaxID=156889 RepID=A0LAI8_MAGMM|nr:GNAT family N-acyltransferase [Magnetococcus marinus]ABK44981.1 phospholipid/glycerol acyltransferase [Magnetococcus marinus MC-1]